jgi:hypothetical protein
MHRSLKIQSFQLTSNDPTSIIENDISLELGLYCSNHRRNTVERTVDVAATVTPGVLQFSGGGPMDHEEAFGSSYMDGGGRRVAIDDEPFTNREAAGDELAPGSLADGDHHITMRDVACA